MTHALGAVRSRHGRAALMALSAVPDPRAAGGWPSAVAMLAGGVASGAGGARQHTARHPNRALALLA